MRIAFNTLHESPDAPSNAVRFVANLADARVLGDPALRADLLERGRRHSHVHNWDRTAAVVLQTYARCA